MLIRIGYELTFELSQPTPMLLMLNVHPSRVDDLVTPDDLRTDPVLPVRHYYDGFGNLSTRLTAPAGRLRLWTDATVKDSGERDPVVPDAVQLPVEALPDETLVYLLGSRYCETDRLSEFAWAQFGATAPGWARVQAICDFVHDRIAFGYGYARSTKTALDAYEEKCGVCRDFAHLAVTLCRCMNIPARYCTGYLGDIGVPPDPAPMDFSAWFEAFLGGRWYTFDARHNVPRIGRVLMGWGRDATDVAMTNTFGPHVLSGFKVVSEEVKG